MAYVGTPIDVGNQFSSLVGKRFSGDASTVAFTLDVRANSALDIEVFVENVRQDPNSAYTVDGTTLTFTAAPPSGTNNVYVVHQAPTVASVSPTAGSVTASSFDNSVISGHTALAATPADTDEFLISDAGTIKRIDYSLIKGLVRQVVSTTKTDTFTTTSSSFTDITGLSVNITPTSTSSKIFVSGTIFGSQDVDANRSFLKLVRGSTGIMVGDTASNRPSATSTLGAQHPDIGSAVSINFLDSPSSNSEQTYKMQVAVTAGSGSAFINRTENDTDQSSIPRFASTITVMEILG